MGVVKRLHQLPHDAPHTTWRALEPAHPTMHLRPPGVHLRVSQHPCCPERPLSRTAPISSWNPASGPVAFQSAEQAARWCVKPAGRGAPHQGMASRGPWHRAEACGAPTFVPVLQPTPPGCTPSVLLCTGAQLRRRRARERCSCRYRPPPPGVPALAGPIPGGPLACRLTPPPPGCPSAGPS